MKSKITQKITVEEKIELLKKEAISNIKKVADNHDGEPLGEQLKKIMEMIEQIK